MPGHLEETVTIKGANIDRRRKIRYVLQPRTSKINAGMNRDQLLDHCAQLFAHVRPSRIIAHREEGKKPEEIDHEEDTCMGLLTDICWNVKEGKDGYLEAEWDFN